MELHDARIGWRCKGFLKSVPNTKRGMSIYHKMQHLDSERRVMHLKEVDLVASNKEKKD